ncbi:MAG: 16S rRNA (guanine(966)-N(2))-methyltransferase RsmD [Chloroflexi bacterium]|nr:16S rRNA (guanine(966)-N(2))-methyltransferase RsmD [Chloroflexota bacterium]
MASRGRGLRVVAGELRGHGIQVAPGTRPTIDRLRAAVFDSLGAPPPPRVLDCYAGSGAFGIEALSRGAEYVRFIERDSRACAVIRANLRRLELEHAASVERADVLRADLAAGGPYGLILADPPYADDPWIPLMNRLAQPGVLASDGLIVAEFSARRAAPEPPPTWQLWKFRRHGDGAFAIYCRSGDGKSGNERTSL